MGHSSAWHLSLLEPKSNQIEMLELTWAQFDQVPRAHQISSFWHVLTVHTLCPITSLAFTNTLLVYLVPYIVSSLRYLWNFLESNSNIHLQLALSNGWANGSGAYSLKICCCLQQMCKYLYHSERLDFTSGLLATEEECSVIDVLPSTLAEMLWLDDIEGLESLILASYWFNTPTNAIHA